MSDLTQEGAFRAVGVALQREVKALRDRVRELEEALRAAGYENEIIREFEQERNYLRVELDAMTRARDYYKHFYDLLIERKREEAGGE